MTVVNTEYGYAERPYAVDPYAVGYIGAAMGWQAEIVSTVALGWQANIVLYNIDHLRILHVYPSRGARVTGGGNNAWGNPKGTGQNWVASSTEPSDTDSFHVNNVNDDLVEKRWQSAAGDVTGIILKCDVEEAQGAFIDTLALLDTNLTSSAIITLEASNLSDFSVIEDTIPLQSDGDEDGHVVYIAPTLPLTGYRYWRISIDDGTNPDDYIRIGTIVFGAAVILTDCFTQEVDLDPINYTDEVFTEAFTNVQNDRGVKKALTLEFRNLKYTEGNYQRLSGVFGDVRTTLKALWVPTPQFPKRFMLYGKLRRLPRERHRVLSETNDLVSLTVEVDESK